MGQPPAPEERTTRLRQRFAGFSFGHAWRLTLFVAVIVTAAFGGLDTVDKQVTPFKPGEEFSDGEYTVTIERARLVDELKGTLCDREAGEAVPRRGCDRAKRRDRARPAPR